MFLKEKFHQFGIILNSILKNLRKQYRMSSFQFTVQLQQHTPILHFQHTQDGATLRATEVKPKLDKWIYDNFEKICQLKSFDVSLKEHFNYHDKKASIYKINIGKADNEEPILIRAGKFRKNKKVDQYQDLDKENIRFIEGTTYFAQESNIDSPIRKETIENKVTIFGLMLKEGKKLDLEIFTFNHEIKKFLQFVTPLFFICKNFGTRQTKGFGSFTVTGTTNDLILNTIAHFFVYKYKKNNISDLDPSYSRLIQMEILFQHIARDYRHIKSGKSKYDVDGYGKSQVYSYGQKDPAKKYNWEKKHIKQEINANKIKNVDLKVEQPKRLSYKSTNNYFVRALLGLTEKYEFLTVPNDYGKYIVKVEHLPEGENRKERDDNKIERFASPLTWKIFNNQIYLFGNELNPKMLNKKFKFTYYLEKEKNDERSMVDLMTPQSFSLEKFLDHCFNIDKTRNNQDQNGPVHNYKKL